MYDFLRSLLGREKFERMRLSPLKVLLYLESHERKERASAPDKLGREIGIGGYDTITQSYQWLLERKYIAVAPDVPAVEPSEIRDPREFVVTPLGKKALRPHLNTFSLREVISVALLTLILGFALGLLYAAYQLYPSYLWLLILVGLITIAVIVGVMTTLLKEERERHKEHAALLMESVADRD